MRFGCAQHILAFSLAEQLANDGIGGKHICSVSWGWRNIDIFEQDGKLASRTKPNEDQQIDSEEFFWTPSFIESSIWKDAITHFAHGHATSRRRCNMATFIKTFLLPLLHPDGLSKDTEHEIVREWMLKMAKQKKCFYRDDAKLFYFDNDQILQCKSIELSLLKGAKFFPLQGVTGGQSDIFYIQQHCLPGSTLDECVDVLIEITKKRHKFAGYSEIDRLMQSIDKPLFQRDPENCNPKTFDYVVVTVRLPACVYKTREELKDAIKRNQEQIIKKILEKICLDGDFKRYGVPISFLHCTNVFLRKNNSLDYIFALKPFEKKEKQ